MKIEKSISSALVFNNAFADGWAIVRIKMDETYHFDEIMLPDDTRKLDVHFERKPTLGKIVDVVFIG